MPKHDNEWIASDRRERRKLIATVLICVGAVAAGIGLLIVGLLGH
jgi:hypothetical protein